MYKLVLHPAIQIQLIVLYTTREEQSNRIEQLLINTENINYKNVGNEAHPSQIQTSETNHQIKLMPPSLSLRPGPEVINLFHAHLS